MEVLGERKEDRTFWDDGQHVPCSHQQITLHHELMKEQEKERNLKGGGLKWEKDTQKFFFFFFFFVVNTPILNTKSKNSKEDLL